MSPLPSVNAHSADRRRLPNPFGCFVGRPLEADDVDVPEINLKAFESCQSLVRGVIADRASAALTLYGEPGTGKTHLLGRVRKWLLDVPGSLFVLARMETNARMLWRHLRRCLADALLRPASDGRRVLDQLLAGRSDALDQLPERDLAIILENLLKGTNLRDAAAWLRGQELPESALARLSVSQPDPEDDQEVSSRNAIVALCSLLDPGPVVFCLDQMEALQNFAGDTEGLFAAGKAISLLHDEAKNTSIICCLQAGFHQTLECALDEPTRQRLLRYSDNIRPLDWAQAKHLIEARLDAIPSVAELRRDHPGPLWPLSADAVQRVFTANAAPARKVISRCKDLFDEWSTGEAPVIESLDDALQRMFDERIEPKEPRDSEAVFRDGLPVLLRALGAAVKILPSPSPLDFSLGRGNAIALCNQSNAISLLNRLRKIGQAWTPEQAPRLLMLRDARLPIGARAKTTRQRLQSIEDRGGRLIPVSAEAVESLAALRRLLADAESGDLAHHGVPIPPGRVERWIAGHLPSALNPLIAQLQAEIDAVSSLSSKLAALLAESKIVSVESAARELQASPEEVESCAAADPRTFGVLGGSTPALFQPVQSE